MADFEDIHRAALNAADGRLRVGEHWRLEIRQPLEIIKLGPGAVDGRATVVTFVAVAGGKLKPASPEDAAIVDDWKKRHRATPPDWFGLPSGIARS